MLSRVNFVKGVLRLSVYYILLQLLQEDIFSRLQGGDTEFLPLPGPEKT